MHHSQYLLLFLLVTTLGSGCSTISYYSQSVSGHLNVMWQAEPIEEVIARPDTSPAVSEQLTRALSIRQFASTQLLLPQNDSYKVYADLKRPYVVWNITAAPEFSLTPQKWCYLVVGCVSYRGYYHEQEARILARHLEGEGLDVNVRGVSAYSTLGWFDDPLLNTMLGWKDTQFAGLIFHELSHQVLYIKDDTDFNEAFASAVERLGVLEWLQQTNPQMMDDYFKRINEQQSFRELIIQTRNQLQEIYGSDISNEEKRKQKRHAFEQMKLRYEAGKEPTDAKGLYDYWFSQPLNNARLLSAMTYMELIPAFYALFLESNRDWNLFYENAKRLSDKEKTERDETLNSLLARKVELQQLLNIAGSAI